MARCNHCKAGQSLIEFVDTVPVFWPEKIGLTDFFSLLTLDKFTQS